MRMIELLDELHDLVDNAGSVPFSNKVVVDPNEVLDLVDAIKEAIPDDVNDAIRIKETEELILGNAEEKAKEMITGANKKARELTDTDEITRSAYERADKLLNKANKEALLMKIGSIQYSSKVLRELQDKLADLMDVVEDNKNELVEMRKSISNSVSGDVDDRKSRVAYEEDDEFDEDDEY